MNSFGLALFLFLLPIQALASEPRNRVIAIPVDVESQQTYSLTEDPSVIRWIEPLYPKKGNAKRAQIELYYVCQDEETGGINPYCWINLEPPVARENAGGHYSGHIEDRPTGKHIPSTGWVDPNTGRFKTTFYASEVAGIVDVTIHCSTGGFGTCSDGTVSFGVGYRNFAELGSGRGYVLTGDKAPHPSNHWGDVSFVTNVGIIASRFSDAYANEPLSYNDISLEMGGVFDVRTRNDPGYDWTPAHETHREGRNMDMSIPRTNASRNFFTMLARSVGISVYREDAAHWHLIY